MRVHWSAKPALAQQKGRTQRDLSLLQIRLRCFQHGILVAGRVQPSPEEEEDGLGRATKVGGGPMAAGRNYSGQSGLGAPLSS